MEIKDIKGTRSEIFVYIDDKVLTITGELTTIPVFYADISSINKWNPPFESIEISEVEKKEIISLIEDKSKNSAVPIVFE